MAGRKWTEEEEEFLEQHWGTMDVDTIAKKIKRTVYAIRKRRIQLGLLNYLDSGDYVTLHKLFYLLKGNCRNCRRHQALINAGCPVKSKRMRGKRLSVKVVNIDDFWAWLKNNPTLVNLANLEPNALGGEPEWVKVKRENDYRYNFAPMKNTPYTIDEERKIKHMAESYRYTYDDIALALGRTTQSIRDKIIFMGLNTRLGNLKEARKWTGAEDRKIVELISQGFTARGLAIKLERGEVPLRGRLAALFGTSSVNEIFHRIQRGEIAC